MKHKHNSQVNCITKTCEQLTSDLVSSRDPLQLSPFDSTFVFDEDIIEGWPAEDEEGIKRLCCR